MVAVSVEVTIPSTRATCRCVRMLMSANVLSNCCTADRAALLVSASVSLASTRLSVMCFTLGAASCNSAWPGLADVRHHVDQGQHLPRQLFHRLVHALHGFGRRNGNHDHRDGHHHHGNRHQPDKDRSSSDGRPARSAFPEPTLREPIIAIAAILHFSSEVSRCGRTDNPARATFNRGPGMAPHFADATSPGRSNSGSGSLDRRLHRSIHVGFLARFHRSPDLGLLLVDQASCLFPRIGSIGCGPSRSIRGLCSTDCSRPDFLPSSTSSEAFCLPCSTYCLARARRTRFAFCFPCSTSSSALALSPPARRIQQVLTRLFASLRRIQHPNQCVPIPSPARNHPKPACSAYHSLPSVFSCPTLRF
jgi:hypothetical protein